MPICPTGILYDLLEVISMQLDQHDVPVDVPVYFISPVAESTLAYSNIYAEWLSEKKQNMVNIPEEPFKHGLNIHGAATVAAYSSGYSIGSCNWIVRTEHEKIGYLSATSSRNSHTKPVQWDQLRGCDALILTSICRFPEHSPETSVCHAFAVIADTLKRNGSVLMPICPTGILYDLLEVISMQLDQHDVPVDVPVYFISPVAESTLAYSNIYAEWLSEKKQNMVNIPEEPFKHGLVNFYLEDFSVKLRK
ncbi:hypothetical protein WUBG_13700, partial [Wuchereria bancrofti]